MVTQDTTKSHALADSIKSHALADSIEQSMQAALSGDAEAYRRFLQAASAYLRRFLSRRVPPAELEDVLQEILISLHKARHTYDGKRAALPWIAAIARYRLADWLRKHYAQGRHQRVDVEALENFAQEDVTESSALYEHIEQEVGNLQERERKILYLMHTEGYTAKEVGRKLGMNESSVKVAAHRAYKRIKAKLAS